MIEPHVHVACAPHGAGLLCATFWIVDRPNVFGWFTGARGAERPACFFALDGYHGKGETVFYRSAQSDAHGGWLVLTASGEIAVATAPVPEAWRIELERLQDAFVREWLFFRDDPGHAEDAAALRARNLPLREVNLRPRKLARLTPGIDAWIYSSAGADLNVISFLGARWPLDYAPR